MKKELKNEVGSVKMYEIYKTSSGLYIKEDICNEYNIGNKENIREIKGNKCLNVSESDIEYIEKESPSTGTKLIPIYISVFDLQLTLSFNVYIDRSHDNALYISRNLCKKYAIKTNSRRIFNGTIHCQVTEEDIKKIEDMTKSERVQLIRKYNEIELNKNKAEFLFVYYKDLRTKETYITRKILELAKSLNIEIEGTPKIVDNKNCYAITEEQIKAIEDHSTYKGIAKLVNEDEEIVIPCDDSISTIIEEVMPYDDYISTITEDVMPYNDYISTIIEDIIPYDDAVSTIVEDVMPYDDFISTIVEDAIPYDDSVSTIVEDVIPYDETISTISENVMNYDDSISTVVEEPIPYNDSISTVTENVIPYDDFISAITEDIIPYDETVSTIVEDTIPYNDSISTIAENVMDYNDAISTIVEDAIPYDDAVSTISENVIDYNDSISTIVEDAIPYDDSVSTISENVMTYDESISTIVEDVIPYDETLSTITENKSSIYDQVTLTDIDNIIPHTVAKTEEIEELIPYDDSISTIVEDAIPYDDSVSTIVEDAIPYDESISTIVEDTIPYDESVSTIVEEPIPYNDSVSTIVEEPIPYNDSVSTISENVMTYDDSISTIVEDVIPYDENVSVIPEIETVIAYRDRRTNKLYIPQQYALNIERPTKIVMNRACYETTMYDLERIYNRKIIIVDVFPHSKETYNVVVCNNQGKFFVPEKTIKDLNISIGLQHKIKVNKEIYVEITSSDLDVIKSKETKYLEINIELKHITPTKKRN